MNMRCLCRQAWHCLFLASLGVASQFSVFSVGLAADLKVILSDDSAPYQEAYQAILTGLQGQDHVVSRIYADRIDPGALDSASLVVTVGVRATESLMQLPSRPPLLAILVPREWYRRSAQPALTRSGAKAASAIYIDQPFERQARLISLAFPDARRVGLVTGGKREPLVRELQAELRKQGLSLAHETISSERELIGALDTLLPSSELLLALPDPTVFNANTAQTIFLTSYRYRNPVLGYSRSMTRAGALLSVYSTPAQVGRQATEWIETIGQVMPLSLPAPSYPDYFSVSINKQVARSLGIMLPAEAELVRDLGRKT